MNGVQYPDNFVKVAVLADPQVLVSFWGIFLNIPCTIGLVISITLYFRTTFLTAHG